MTTNGNHRSITKPTKTKIVIYDTEQEDKPTYESIAKSELSGNAYAHEISFKIKKSSTFFVELDIFLGLLVILTINDQQFESVLTFFKIEEDFIEAKFGNLRSRVTDYMED